MAEHINPTLVEATVSLSRRLAAGDLEPPGGAIAALVAAWAASLAAAAADRSREGWEGAAGARAQAQALRTRALRLLERGERAHAQAMETLARRGDEGAEREDVRDWRLGRAVREAAEPPLELAACALSVAELARVIASHAAGEVNADAAVAAQLAAAASRAGAHLVEINLVVGGNSELAVQARELAEAAAAAATQASALD